MTPPLPRFALLLALAPVVCTAAAGTERVSLSVGAFVTDRDTNARLDSETLGLGTVINFEDDLGLSSSGTVARADALYRFSRRHRLDIAYFDLSRSATALIDEELQFGDEVFAIDTQINAEFGLQIFKLAYNWAFIARDKGSLALSAGLFTAITDARLREDLTGLDAESRDIAVPLPVVGLRGEYEFASRWSLRGSVEYFGLEIADIRGRLLDFQVGVDYHFTDRFAVGVAYNDVALDVTSENADLLGKLDWTYGGALLYFRADFGSVERSDR